MLDKIRQTASRVKSSCILTRKSMGWPTPQDYNEALQNPHSSFLDWELKEGKPELNSLGLPRPMTGAFASVYRLKCSTKDYAVRCFLKSMYDQQDRYAQLSKYITGDDLIYTVGFQFIEKGLNIHGNWYPLLRMDWVEGLSLDNYVRRHVRQPTKIRELAESFVRMSQALQSSGVAHGDLQHGNILVTVDDLRLVDYDGMYVPGLAGLESNELGHRNYQHPLRTSRHFGPYLDNFSCWVIWTSLLCLSEDPVLWDNVTAGDECLIFKQADFLFPSQSITFGRLAAHRNLKITQAIGILKRLLAYPPEYVPPLNAKIATAEDLPLLPAGVSVSDRQEDLFSGGPTPAPQASACGAAWQTRGKIAPAVQEYAALESRFQQDASLRARSSLRPPAKAFPGFSSPTSVPAPSAGAPVQAPGAGQLLVTALTSVRHLFQGFFQQGHQATATRDSCGLIEQADALFEKGDFTFAANIYRHAISGVQSHGSPVDQIYLKILLKIASCYSMDNADTLAITYLQNARVLAGKVAPSLLPQIGIQLGMCLYRTHKYQDAILVLKGVLPPSPLLFGPIHQAILSPRNSDPLLGDILFALGKDFEDNSDFNQAKNIYECAHNAYVRSKGPKSLAVGLCLHAMARCACQLGQTLGLIETYTKSLEILLKEQGPGSQSVIAVTVDLSRFQLMEAKRYLKVSSFWLAREKYLEALKHLETLKQGALPASEVGYMAQTICAAAPCLPQPVPLLRQFAGIAGRLGGTDVELHRIESTIQELSKQPS